MVRSAEKVKKGETVRNICQKVVQLADKGEKVKKGENKLKFFGLFIYMDLFYIIIF